MNIIPKQIFMCDKTLQFITTFSKNWQKLNPDYKIHLYDDQMCTEFLLQEFGQLYVDIFNYITSGPIKADFWRICILFKKGGVYVDADNEPLQPLHSFIDPSASFVTCSSYFKTKPFIYNPNFIMCMPGEPILAQCIDWYINKFKKKEIFIYWNWSIMNCFTDVLKLQNFNKESGIYNLDSNHQYKVQIIKECPGKNHSDAHNMYNGVRVFNNRYKEWDAKTHSFKT